MIYQMVSSVFDSIWLIYSILSRLYSVFIVVGKTL